MWGKISSFAFALPLMGSGFAPAVSTWKLSSTWIFVQKQVPHDINVLIDCATRMDHKKLGVIMCRQQCCSYSKRSFMETGKVFAAKLLMGASTNDMMDKDGKLSYTERKKI